VHASDRRAVAAQGRQRRAGSVTGSVSSERVQDEVVATIDPGRLVCGGRVRRIAAADWAQPPRRVVLPVQLAFAVAVTGPGGRQLKLDPVSDRGGDQRAAAPGAVRLKARVEVLGVAG